MLRPFPCGTLADRRDGLLERAQDHRHGGRLGVRAHQADAPDRVGVGAHAGADLDVEVLEQVGAHGGVVHSLGHLDGGQVRQTVALDGEELEAHLLQAGLQRLAGGAVAGDDVGQALVEDAGDRRAQRDDHAGRGGVVVGALGAGGLAGVAAEHAQVQVPGPRVLHSALPGAVGDGERRQARGNAHALLGAGVADVDTPLVGLELDAGDGGHGVDQQQGVALAAADLGDVAGDTGGGLGVDDGEDLRVGVGLGQLDRVDGAAPLEVDAHDLGAHAGGDVAHALAEQAVDADDDHVAGLDEVDEGGLHAAGAGGRQRQGAGVLGAPQGAQSGADLVHLGDELGVQVAEQRAGQRRGGLRVGVARPGAEKVTGNEV